MSNTQNWCEYYIFINEQYVISNSYTLKRPYVHKFEFEFEFKWTW